MSRGARLELAVRLGLVTRDGAVALGALNGLRDKLAHGDADEISPGLLGNLTNAAVPLLAGYEDDVRRFETPYALRWILVAVHLELHGSIDSWRNVREYERAAIERDRDARRKELAFEVIQELLDEADAGPDRDEG